MRSRMMKWLVRGALATLVAGVMLAVGPQYAAGDDCPEPSAGTCPPLANLDGSCSDACELLDYDGGTCVGPCCTCFLR
jgi:hypothetical protein